MDYQRNLLYFTGEDNLSGCIMAAICVFAFVVAIKAGNTAMLAVSVVLFVIGVIQGWGEKKWPVSDADYDALIESYTASLKSLALDKLGVDESEVNEVTPIILGGYEFDGVEKVKQGSDSKWRSNIYKVVMLFFSRNELHCYTMRFNTLRDEKTEGTDVFFYQDIVSASTSSLTFKVNADGKEITINPEAFKLTTKGGTSFTVNILNAQQAHESVNAMRALLREKKQA